MRLGGLDGSIEPSPTSSASILKGVNAYPVSSQIAVGVGTTGAVVVLMVAVSLAMRCVACVRRRREGGSTNYVPFDDSALDGDEILPNARLSTKALPGGMSQKSSGTISTGVSVASFDSAIAAPEIPNHETIGGSGVGFLDERGVPIVLSNNIDDEEKEEESTVGEDDFR